MGSFLEALGIIALVILAIVAMTVAFTMRALVRANRVATDRRSGAPIWWLISLKADARLHRRLRRAVDVTEIAVSSVAPSALVLRDVATELVGSAVTLDDQLVAYRGLHPQARRPRTAHLAGDVRQIEASAARLSQLSYDWRASLDQATQLVDAPAPDLHQRLDAVEAALRELPTMSSQTADMFAVPTSTVAAAARKTSP